MPKWLQKVAQIVKDYAPAAVSWWLSKQKK